VKVLEVPSPKLLTVTEAARLAGLTDGRVRQLLRAGAIKGIKASPVLWLIPAEEAEKLKVPSQFGRPRRGISSQIA
jgi:excisionase family DNA binding protein